MLLLPPVEEPAGGVPAAASIAEAPVESRRGWRSIRLLWWLSALVIVFDQIAKSLVRSVLPYLDSRPIIPGFVDLVHVQNDGVAFGLLNNSSLPLKPLVTSALAGLALAGIGFYARHVREEERLARIGLSLILGGALGNLVDRLRQGYVIDFVDVYWHGWHFWAFNVADASITIGAILVFVDLLVVSKHAPHPVPNR
jgi:signal peptidase II